MIQFSALEQKFDDKFSAQDKNFDGRFSELDKRFATKSDLENMTSKLVMWAVGTAIAGGGLVLTGVGILMTVMK